MQVVPYVSDRLAVAPVGKIARRFQRCPGKSEAVQFVRFEGLLDGGGDESTEEEWRRTALQQLGEFGRQLFSTRNLSSSSSGSPAVLSDFDGLTEHTRCSQTRTSLSSCRRHPSTLPSS